MRLLEHEAKSLLANVGLRVPKGGVARSAEEAYSVATELGAPTVVKAQVPAGGRMKAGGVGFADTASDAATLASRLLSTGIRTTSVASVLVEQRIHVVAEVFVAALYDPGARAATVVASTFGGIEVESESRVISRQYSVGSPPPEFLGRELAASMGFEGAVFLALARIITRLARCLVEWDALLVEVNPLALDADGNWWALDAHIELDDDAAFRQGHLRSQLPESALTAGKRDEFEHKADVIDRSDHRGVAGRLVSFGGDLGLLIGGGGASLTIMDALLNAGIEPANYCEIGGNPSVWKIKELTKLILAQPRVRGLAVIMNVVSNTRSDLVARGAIKGVLECGKQPADVILAFRLPGSWEAEGEIIVRNFGVPFFGRQTSIDDVVDAIATRLQGEQRVADIQS